MKKKSFLKKVLCFMLCLCFLNFLPASLVYASEKDSLILHEFNKDFFWKDKNSHSKNVDIIQTFILDSMESKNNEDIAEELSGCNTDNILKKAKKISGLLKGTWKSKKGTSQIEKILTDYNKFTPKARLSIVMVIDEGFDGVRLPFYFSRSIREKINADMTGNRKDDRGIKFMVKSLQIVNRVTSLKDERLITVTTHRNSAKVEFNNLENYQNITSSVSNVLKTLDSLPFKSRDYDGFINYYENYINKSSTLDVVSFIYLLKINNIPFTTRTK